jgi:hypothetical protein
MLAQMKAGEKQINCSAITVEYPLGRAGQYDCITIAGRESSVSGVTHGVNALQNTESLSISARWKCLFV